MTMFYLTNNSKSPNTGDSPLSKQRKYKSREPVIADLTMIFRCLVFLLFLSIINTAPIERKIDYTGHQVFRIHVQNETQLLLLDQLEENESLGIDFWSEPIANSSIDLHVPPDARDHVIQYITEAGMTYEVLIPDIQNLINHEDDPSDDIDEFFAAPLGVTPPKGRRRRSAGWSGGPDGDYYIDDELDFYWLSPMGRYATHDEINTWLRTIPNYQPDLARVVDIGYSFEGRDIKVIKIGSPGSNKPAIWIDGGFHAREWIAPATAVCIVHILVALYGEDDVVTRLVNTYDWFILPVANPDGYVYTHETDRMWRKTRSFSHRTYVSRCRGVDPNRNFDFKWLGHCESNLFARCRSSRPCSSTYAGERPFSEMETISIANYILRRRSLFKMYISLHSYSQLWLTPWSYTRKEPDDNDHVVRVANISVEALTSVYNTSYITGSPAVIIYSAGGTSFDWAKGVAGIKYSYTLELRDRGQYGFLLPRRYIVPVCEETWQGIKTAALQLIDELF